MAEYIEREVALLSLNPIVKRASERNRNIYSAVKQCVEAINWCPSADVQPVRHGRWNEESPDCLDGDSVYVCSVCGETWTLIEGTPLDNNMHYCPNCGAKMDGGET